MCRSTLSKNDDHVVACLLLLPLKVAKVSICRKPDEDGVIKLFILRRYEPIPAFFVAARLKGEPLQETVACIFESLQTTGEPLRGE